MKAPKFKIGQIVNHKPDLYGCTVSEIVEIDRIFDNKDGGLAYVESHWDYNREDIKMEIIEGEFPVLVIHPYESMEWDFRQNKMTPQMTKRQEIKFSGYVYSVRSEKMNTLFAESQLR